MAQENAANEVSKAPGSRLKAAVAAVSREWNKLRKNHEPMELLALNVMAGAPIGCAAAYFMTPQGMGLLGPFVAAGLTFLSGTSILMGMNKLDALDAKADRKKLADSFMPKEMDDNICRLARKNIASKEEDKSPRLS